MNDHPLREPNRPGWVRNIFKAPIPTRHVVWDNWQAKLRVISTIESDPWGTRLHLSISEAGGRYPRRVLIDKVRKEFDAMNFEQDDGPSKIAHLWLTLP